jgi:methanogenic corrinoid protein MtbC1
MTAINDTPTYNLKVVLRETGIKADTIRAWERRYGLPEPERTAGRHRLYSQRDIEMIKWLMARQDEGLSISRAVNLWRSIEAEGRDPLQDEAYQAAPQTAAPALEISVGAALDEIRQSWVDACLNFDEARADATLAHAFALYPVEVACTEILQKGISEIGQQWFFGKASVQQEHFASALAIRKIDTMISASPVPFQNEKVVVACPPGEDHTVPALLITLFLRQRGWPVIYLGANVPISELNETIKHLKPSLLVMPAQQLHTAASLSEVANKVESKVLVAFGGLIFNLVPEIRKRIPGHYIGEDIINVVATIEHLIRQKPPIPQVQAPSDEYHQALSHFQELQAAIEAQTWEALSNNGIDRQHLTIANRHLTQDIEAALFLGDLNYLANEFTWLEELLTNYEIPPYGLHHYLATYLAVAQQTLDERGHLIVDWLSEALEAHQ